MIIIFDIDHTTALNWKASFKKSLKRCSCRKIAFKFSIFALNAIFIRRVENWDQLVMSVLSITCKKCVFLLTFIYFAHLFLGSCCKWSVLEARKKRRRLCWGVRKSKTLCKAKYSTLSGFRSCFRQIAKLCRGGEGERWRKIIPLSNSQIYPVYHLKFSSSMLNIEWK